ncbi:hypothetical protein [Zobellia uliginosa]|nr:hypothetical protein [Zobellia uliginosa]MDO6515848.1 hypothetical protein [Zobellia uliginosa]
MPATDNEAPTSAGSAQGFEGGARRAGDVSLTPAKAEHLDQKKKL